MANNESWFEGLVNPEGIHVRVKTYNDESLTGSVIYGELDRSGGMHIGDVYIQVLDLIPSSGVWQKHGGIESVKYLWNEANYDLIVPQNIQEGDYIQVGDGLFPITSVEKTKNSSVDGVLLTYSMCGYSFKVQYNTYALRRNSIPTEPGLYESEHDGYYLLNPDDESWYKLKQIQTKSLSDKSLITVAYF